MKHRRIITKMRVAVAQARFAVCVLFFAFAAVFAAEARAQTAADVDECALGTDTCGADHLCGNTDGGFVCGQRCPNGFVSGSNRTECAETCDSASRMLDADNDCVLLANIREDVATRMCVDAGWFLEYVISIPPGEVLGTVLGRECSIPYRDATAQTDESGCWVSSQNLSTARSQGLTTASQYCWELFIQSGAPLASAHGADDRYVHTCPDEKEPGADLKSCVCPAGYVTDRDGSCVDINECAADANTCGANDACVNIVGGHACECGAGHSKISETLASQCADIDECAAGTDSCGAENLCENTVGGFTCTPCPAGFQPNGDRGECVSAPAACPPGEMRNESGSCVCDATRRMSANGQCAPTQSGAFQICRDKGWTVVEPVVEPPVGAECRIPYRNVAAQTDEAGCLLRDDNQSDFHKRQFGLTATTPCAELFLEDELIPLAADHAAGDRYVHSCPQGFIVSNDLKECVCPQGRIDIDGICADINECADNTHACGENTLCVNIHGGYQCACQSGHEFETPNGLQCADINECAAATDSCGANALCANTLGGHVCGNECPAGFTPSADRSECVESDPCPAGETRDENGDCMCDPATRFINTGFGNACHITASAATQMCRDSGWNVVTVFHNSVTLGAVCAIPYRDETAQTDETGCSLWRNYRHAEFVNWDSHQTTSQRCRNLFDARPVPTTLNHSDGDRYVHSCPGGKTPTADSKRCVCPEGWTEDDSGMCNADINECAANTHSCGANAECVNTEGGHACECDAGYAPGGDWTLQNPQCADINECAAETDSCGENSLCDNTLGGFVCGNECPDGFIPNDDRSECVDASVCPPLHILDSVNGECVCDSAQAAYAGEICVPRTAATTCETAGWQTETHEHLGNILKVECLIPLRNAATKVNEGGCFLLPPADNSIADYQTDATKSCYEIFGDDIPMTLTHSPNDHYVHTCPGMKVQSADYKTCECPAGYEENADGFCVDIDECAIGAHSCGENSQCVNTEGAHACACAAGYSSVGDWTFLDPQCRDVNECALGTDDCGPNTLCGNLAGGYVCESACPDGMHVNLLRTKCEPCPPGEMQDENGECVCDPETRFRNTGYGGACHLTSDGATTTCLEAGWLVATVTHNNNVLGAVCKIPYRDETAKADETGCSLWHYLSHPDLDHWGEYETTSQRCRDLFDAYTIPLTLNHVAGDRYVHTCPPPKTPSDDLKSCDCPVGYEKDAEGNCVDINECETDAHTCGANAQCTNTPGEHICSCSPGYQSTDASLQNLQCEDIDECSTGAHSCGGQDSAQCVNTDGDYQCACYVNHAPLNPNDPKNPQCLGTYDLTLSQSANGTLYAEYGGATVSAPVNYVPQGAAISIVADPDSNFYILEWSGDCSHLRGGTPKRRGRPKICRLAMNSHKTAAATYESTWTTQFNSANPGGTLVAQIQNSVTLQTADPARAGVTVIYTAQPDPDFYLLKWTGECESEPAAQPADRGAQQTCARVLNANHQVGAIYHRAVSITFTPRFTPDSSSADGTLFAVIKHDEVTLQSGDVAPQGATILYTAQPASLSYLRKWTGECESEPAPEPSDIGAKQTCRRILNAPHQVGATFHGVVSINFTPAPQNGTLSARLKATGATLQTGDLVPRGTTVVYAAQPAPQHYLQQWTGPCANRSSLVAPRKHGLAGTCEIPADNNATPVAATFAHAHQANFDATPPNGNINARVKDGLTLQPGDLAPVGATIIYTARPHPASYLLKWTGECETEPGLAPADFGSPRTCQRQLNANHQVGAVFQPAVQLIFASELTNGTLSARVKNGPPLRSGVVIDRRTTVVYSAHPDDGFLMLRWSGACANQPLANPNEHGAVQTCELSNIYTPIAARFVPARETTFDANPQHGTLSAQIKNGVTLQSGHFAPSGVTLLYIAQPDPDAYVLQWTGDCENHPPAAHSDIGQPRTCAITLNDDSQAGVIFRRFSPVAFVPQTNGTLSAQTPDGTPLLPGDIPPLGVTIVYTAMPDPDSYLLKWTGACAHEKPATPNDRGIPQKCKVADAALPVDAIFARAWKISFNDSPSPNGTLSARIKNSASLQSGDNVREGTTVVYTAAPSSKRYLSKWTGGCESEPPADPENRGEHRTCERTPTADITVGATYESAWKMLFTTRPLNGTLAARTMDGETLQPEDIVRDGTTVIFTATPNSKCFLLEWDGACRDIAPTSATHERGAPRECQMIANSDYMVDAIFRFSRRINFNALPQFGALSARMKDGEELTPGDFVMEGSTVIFTATPSPGYKMTGWLEQLAGDCESTFNPALSPAASQTCEATIDDDSFGVSPPVPIFASSCPSIKGARGDINNPGQCVCADPAHLIYADKTQTRYCAPPTVCPAGYSNENNDCIPSNASGLPDYANTPDGCNSIFGGEVRTIGGTQPACLGLDIQGTFCFIGSKEVFPCRGLFKHVLKCNRLNRPALNPFICAPSCSEATNTARGQHCGTPTAPSTTPTGN